MSLSSILRPEAKDENWTKIYVHELNAANLNVDNLTIDSLTVTNLDATHANVGDMVAQQIEVSNINAVTTEAGTLTIGDIPNYYVMPLQLGTRRQILQANGVAHGMEFADNIIAMVPFGSNIGSAPNYFKYSSPTNSSPSSNVSDYGVGFNVPLSARVRWVSYSTQLGVGNTQWTLIVNGVATTVLGVGPTQNGSFEIIPSINLLVGDRIGVGLIGGSTFPGEANITLWLVQD